MDEAPPNSGLSNQSEKSFLSIVGRGISLTKEYIPRVNPFKGANYLRQPLVLQPRRSTLHHSGARVLAGAHRAAPAVRERRAVSGHTDTASGQRKSNPGW